MFRNLFLDIISLDISILTKKKERNTSDVFQQINEDEFIYVSNYDPRRKRANNFTLEHFDGNEMKFKIKAKIIRWIEKDSVFRLSNYSKRTFISDKERYEERSRKDTIFDFFQNSFTRSFGSQFFSENETKPLHPFPDNGECIVIPSIFPNELLA